MAFFCISWHANELERFSAFSACSENRSSAIFYQDMCQQKVLERLSCHSSSICHLEDPRLSNVNPYFLLIAQASSFPQREAAASRAIIVIFVVVVPSLGRRHKNVKAVINSFFSRAAVATHAAAWWCGDRAAWMTRLCANNLKHHRESNHEKVAKGEANKRVRKTTSESMMMIMIMVTIMKQNPWCSWRQNLTSFKWAMRENKQLFFALSLQPRRIENQYRQIK